MCWCSDCCMNREYEDSVAQWRYSHHEWWYYRSRLWNLICSFVMVTNVCMLSALPILIHQDDYFKHRMSEYGDAQNSFRHLSECRSFSIFCPYFIDSKSKCICGLSLCPGHNSNANVDRIFQPKIGRAAMALCNIFIWNVFHSHAAGPVVSIPLTDKWSIAHFYHLFVTHRYFTLFHLFSYFCDDIPFYVLAPEYYIMMHSFQCSERPLLFSMNWCICIMIDCDCQNVWFVLSIRSHANHCLARYITLSVLSLDIGNFQSSLAELGSLKGQFRPI